MALHMGGSAWWGCARLFVGPRWCSCVTEHGGALRVRYVYEREFCENKSVCAGGQEVGAHL